MKIKNSIKKVSAVAGSALMVGLTMGSAASLADFPQPFVEDDGTVASQIVVGSDGKVADVVGAVNIAASAGQAAVQTEERTAGGSSSAGWNANNGATLSTQNTQLFFQDSLTKSGLKTTMTEDDLNLLESGTVSNVDGDSYDYDQYVEVGDKATSISDGGELDDETLMIDFGTTAEDSALYTARTTFEQGLNTTDAADDNAEIELFGKDFTISGDSDLSEDEGDTIVLFGGQETASVGEDSSTTVTVDGNEIDLYVDSVVGNDEANVEIDGSLKDGVNEGDTFSVSGIDEEVRVDRIVHRGELDYGQRGTVVFSIGSEKLTLTDGSNVQVGSDEDDVDGTHVTINDGVGTNNGGADLSKLEIEVAGPEDEESFLQAGEQFEDPVFETFSFAFGGMSPEEEADSRSMIEQGVSDDVGTLTITDDNDNSATVNVAELDTDNDVVEYTDDYSWGVVEGAELSDGDRFIVDSGDFTHVLYVDDIPSSDDGDVELEDAMSGTTYTASLDGDNGNIYIDGQEYHVQRQDNGESDDTVQVTWGTGANHGTTGDETTVYPAMEDANGAEVAMTTNDAYSTTFDSQSEDSSMTLEDTLRLPTGDVKVWVQGDGASGTEATNNEVTLGLPSGNETFDGSGTSEFQTVGQVEYDFQFSNLGDTADYASLDVSLSGQSASSEHEEPAALVVEEEDEDDSEQNAFMLTFTNDDDEMIVEEPTYTSGKIANGDLDDDDIHLTEYGTYVLHDEDDDQFVEVHYPDNQATVGAGFVADNGELSTSGGGESVSYEAVTGMGSLPNMARLDSEVTETTKSENHLILVGGPAVNTLVSDLVDSGDVDMSQLEGQDSGALLQTVDDAFASGQDAMVVAGVAGSDTREAARYISNYDAHSEALEDQGSSMVLTEAQYMSEN